MGSKFVLFVLSLSEQKFKTYIMMGMFSCVKWTER